MPIITWLAGALAQIIGYSVIRFIAWKAVAYALLVTILPIVLTNLFYSIIQGYINISNTYASGGGISSQIVQLTGIAAYLASHLKIVEGISVLLSAVVFRVGLKLIPFLRL